MEGRRRRSREFEKGKANFSPATRSATGIRRSDFDASTDSGDGRESFDATRSASSAIVEEEIAYRKQLQEHLSKFSDKREDAKWDAMSEASDAEEDMISKASRFLPKGESSRR